MKTYATTHTRPRTILRSVLLLAGALAALTSAQAQSVQVSGDITPIPALNPQSAWNLGADELTVGNTSSGSLVISDGGRIFGDDLNDNSDFLKVSAIGRSIGSSGEVTVTGAGSLWATSRSLHIGRSGTGSLVIENGGRVTSGIDSVIGSDSGSHGTATVTGAGSSWTAGYNIYVGFEGTGSLTVAGGARISNGTYSTESESNQGDGYIGYGGGARGHVTVTGAGSSWTNHGDLILGGDSLTYAASDASGTLTVENGGTVTVDGTIQIHASSTLAVQVSGHDPAVTVGGDLSNDGLMRLSAAPRLSAGNYNPLEVAGELSGSGRYQAIGGTWDSGSRTFIVTEAAAAFAGEQATLDLTETQRITITGDNGTVSAAFNADDQAAGGGSVISFTATENNITEINGQTVLAAWDFQTTLDSSGTSFIEISMGITAPVVVFPDMITVWSIDSDFNPTEIVKFTFTRTGNSLGRSSASLNTYEITFEMDGPGSYAITLAPIPEPASFAALAGLGALGLVVLRRKRRST